MIMRAAFGFIKNAKWVGSRSAAAGTYIDKAKWTDWQWGGGSWDGKSWGWWNILAQRCIGHNLVSEFGCRAAATCITPIGLLCAECSLILFLYLPFFLIQQVRFYNRNRILLNIVLI